MDAAKPARRKDGTKNAQCSTNHNHAEQIHSGKSTRTYTDTDTHAHTNATGSFGTPVDEQNICSMWRSGTKNTRAVDVERPAGYALMSWSARMLTICVASPRLGTRPLTIIDWTRSLMLPDRVTGAAMSSPWSSSLAAWPRARCDILRRMNMGLVRVTAPVAAAVDPPGLAAAAACTAAATAA
jgi:hypothetical protein